MSCFGHLQEGMAKGEGKTVKREHLHLIREKKPEPRPEYRIREVWCPDCKQIIYVIHLELPPENPT